jgi:hypothetical protein
MEKLGISVININTTTKVWLPMECMLLTNQRIMDFGLSSDAKARRAVPAKKSASTKGATKPTKPTSSTPNNSSASKLSLSKSLQAALLTTAGIFEDQFNKIWANACSSALGN